MFETTDGSIDAVLSVAIGAYSVRTIKGYAADLRIFRNWCAARSSPWLPASPETTAAFVDDQVQSHCISTIKRRLCAIAFAHRLRDLPTPIDANVVRLAVRRAARRRVSRPKQVRGLTSEIRAKIVARCPDTLAGYRDAALISVGYDTLCRSSELSAMLVENVRFEAEGAATIMISRSKSDVAGKGRVAHVSPGTANGLRRWLEAADLNEGPLFRSLHLGRPHERALTTSSIRRLIKRSTQRTDLDPIVAMELSGHSMRVGAAQDMMVAGFDALAISQAGGWRSANVVLRYVENTAAKSLHESRWKNLERSGKNRSDK